MKVNLFGQLDDGYDSWLAPQEKWPDTYFLHEILNINGAQFEQVYTDQENTLEYLLNCTRGRNDRSTVIFPVVEFSDGPRPHGAGTAEIPPEHL